jgi:PIG-X / PBN1
LDPLSGQITENAWSVTVESPPGAEKVEVGILSNETPADPSEFNLSGFLTVVGEDDHPKPTLFSFPSRHHSLPPSQAKQQQYTISFHQPTGLHPTMQISFPNASALVSPVSKSPSSTCALHAYLTLPSPIFADKYQLSSSDPVFLASHNLVALRSISGETDLEAPDYLVEKWGSNLLVELATLPNSLSTTTRFNSYFAPKSNDKIGWDITIPLHLRYLPPSSGGQSTIPIPHPILFWACTEQCGSKFPVNPFDRVNLGYEALFGVRTMFWHLDPNPNSISGGESGVGSGSVIGRTVDAGRLVQHINVPVLNTSAWAAEWVELGTVLAVSLGFAWVCWKLLPSLRLGMGSEGRERVGGADAGGKVEGQGVKAKAKDEGKKTQ